MDAMNVTAGQVLLAVAVILLVAAAVQWLQGGGNPKPAVQQVQNKADTETASETPAESAAPAESRAHALPVRVLYASELGTAKGESGFGA